MSETEKFTLDKTTANIILYFITELNGVLGKTHLQKLLFLSELIASKKFKTKLTNIDFKLYHYGPFSEQVDQYTAYLETKNLIRIEQRKFSNNPNKTYVRYFADKSLPVKQNIKEILGSDKALVLDEVAGSFGNMSLRELLDIVYDLQTVKTAKKEQQLDLLSVAKTTKDDPEDTEEVIDIFDDIHQG